MHHEYYGGGSYSRDCTAPLAVFNLFPRVKRLQASWQVDPKCYEFWDAKRLDRALVELIRYRDERFPNLNSISIHIVNF
ncbi:hypothetical protein F5Y00DRAFT_248960 [Daldinia vernicosa]|uniref:uncharacterized protein n=1 Tax=Daldinia vernicosa TaxID=114800 RepID=UPI002008C0F0|nr:uncharacterized protein F5Y00DRAFT_248960 [Daldinia vernicosa]KAI0844340.1 hypothetical protein F5Y00DRAFT_248960 [Daldinia vernicosa]